MKKQALLFAFVMILGSVVAFSTGALAPNPLAAAPGGGQGPGGPGDGGGDGEIPDYGDLFILYRDASGIPILTPETQVQVPDEEGELVWVDAGLCQQPIAAEPFDGCDTTPGGECLVPVDQVTCAVAEGYATYTQEVDFGRINEVRSPESVFESQLEDATVKLATADAITLDAAGRMVACTDGTDAGVDDLPATIDSPLQNLAIYKKLMTDGSLSVEIPGDSWLVTAARGLGVASDKGGEVTVDMVAYVNQMLGLTDVDASILNRTCINVREEVMGVVGLVEKCFLNYGPDGGADFRYRRQGNFGSLPTAGTFEYLALVDGTGPGADTARFLIDQDTTIMDAVFKDSPGFNAVNIGGFAQAADDTRAVIDFMHSNPVPSDYATAVTCEADPSITYDVSISDVSGLQVPVRMVAGTEGREFIVAIANGGPDVATGTVTVTASDNDGNPITGMTDPDGNPITGLSEEFTLAKGESDSWTQGFSIDQVTTIYWTATVEAQFDVNDSNNSVTEETKVIGGGGRP